MRRAFWVGRLAALTVIAYFVASGTSRLLIGPLFEVAPVQAAARVRGVEPERRVDGTAVVERNIFESSRPVAVEQSLSVCGGGMQLVSTLVAADPRDSFAAFRQGDGTRLARIGGAVEGGAIARIGWRAVLVENPDGSACTLSLFGPRVPAPPRRTVTAPAAEAAVAGVQRLGEDSVAVDRAVVDRLMESPAELARLARVLPKEVDGRLVGFQLVGIRRGGLLAALGLQNGDVVHQVNDVELTSPDVVLRAVGQIGSTDRFRVVLTRHGTRRQMDVEVR